MTMNKLHLARIRAHQANLDRYCRILATHLTELERNFLHRRITEEHAALSRLEAEAFASANSEEAHPDTVVAASALAKEHGGHSHH